MAACFSSASCRGDEVFDVASQRGKTGDARPSGARRGAAPPSSGKTVHLSTRPPMSQLPRGKKARVVRGAMQPEHLGNSAAINRFSPEDLESGSNRRAVMKLK